MTPEQYAKAADETKQYEELERKRRDLEDMRDMASTRKNDRVYVLKHQDMSRFELSFTPEEVLYIIELRLEEIEKATQEV